MSLLEKQLDVGDLKGVVYDFEFVGDKLPMHFHSENACHITVVARGSLKVKGPDWEKDYQCGAILDFEPYQEHEFVALENNTRLVNILKKQVM